MERNHGIKLLQHKRRYSCMDTLIMIIFYLTISATVILGVQLFLVSFGIKIHTLIELRLFESYLSMDTNILLGISIFAILFGVLGLLSGIQYSSVGLRTSIASLILLLIFFGGYVIIVYRGNKYISKLNLYYILNKAMENNPLDNIEFHLMQNTLVCCGINSYEDWLEILPVIPGSCCDNSTICFVNDPTLYKNGCLDVVYKILNDIYSNTMSIFVALNIVAIIAIFTGCFGSHLMKRMKRGGQILGTAIPRIQVNNGVRNQQIEPIPIMQNNTPNLQIISGHIIPTPPPMYPNLQAPNI